MARAGVVKHLLVERTESENLIVILSTRKWKGETESSFASREEAIAKRSVIHCQTPNVSFFMITSGVGGLMQSKNVDLPALGDAPIQLLCY